MGGDGAKVERKTGSGLWVGWGEGPCGRGAECEEKRTEETSISTTEASKTDFPFILSEERSVGGTMTVR